jgi:tetratricopeptide (TPR) repeat protein
MIAESYYFDWETAEQELRTAIRLAPNYVTAHHWYAEFLTMMGKFDQAEAEFEVARNLDPASAIVLTDLAQLYNFQKKYQRSIETLDEVLKLDPSFHLAHDRKAYALILMRRPVEALGEFEIANRQAGRQSSPCEEAWVAAVEGRRRQALELTRLAERDDPNAFVLSVIWAELGDSDRAGGWLQKMYDGRVGGLISIKVNPVFDRLRSSQRFRALLKQMNLT